MGEVIGALMYLSIKELSKYLQINYAKSKKPCKGSQLSQNHIWRKKVFPKDQVLAWMDKRPLRLKESLVEKVEETSAIQYNTESARV